MAIKDFTPTKGIVWTAIGASALTMVLGFTWGGWVTQGAANQSARQAATAAQVELASTICAANFMASPDARAQHAELVALSGFQQRGFVEKQPWALMPGETRANRQVADGCARLIAAMEPDTFASADDMVQEELLPEGTETNPG